MVFCWNCGTKNENGKFCRECGQELNIDKSKEKKKEILTFNDFYKAKDEERQSYFKKKSNRFFPSKNKIDNREVTSTTINVAFMERKGQNYVVKRGSKLPVKVEVNASAFETKQAAFEKMKRYNPEFIYFDFCDLDLVYRTGEIVRNLPGTSIPFTIKKYKDDLGVGYHSILLYLVPYDEDEERVSGSDNNDDILEVPAFVKTGDKRKVGVAPGLVKKENSGDDDLAILWSKGPQVICEICGSTYEDDICLKCLQNMEYDRALELDRNKARDDLIEEKPESAINTKMNVNNNNGEASDSSREDEPTLQSVRAARLSRFSKKPLRFRHSVGSPSLSVSASSKINKIFLKDEEEFGAKDTEHYLNEYAKSDVPATENVSKCHSDCKTENDVLVPAFKEYYESRQNRLNKRLVIQRSNFWTILFKQNFDAVEHNLLIRFAGEKAADGGGPFRAFLLLAMKRMHELTNLMFGKQDQLCFTLESEAYQNKQYFILGQLTALAIIYIGRGPENLHPAVVRSIFNQPQPNKIEPVDNAFIKNNLSEIENENFESAIQLGIATLGKTKEDIKWLYMLNAVILQHFAAISQYREGIKSISNRLVEESSLCVTKSYFEYRVVTYTSQRILDVIHYPQLNALEEGSNSYKRVVDSITEFELFLCSIENETVIVDEEVITYGRFLEFCTAADRIPAHGFEKNIDVSFTSTSLPRASTCGFTLECPFSEIEQAFTIAFKFCGGFGNV